VSPVFIKCILIHIPLRNAFVSFFCVDVISFTVDCCSLCIVVKEIGCEILRDLQFLALPNMKKIIFGILSAIGLTKSWGSLSL
jgi:hypothetical protein